MCTRTTWGVRIQSLEEKIWRRSDLERARAGVLRALGQHVGVWHDFGFEVWDAWWSYELFARRCPHTYKRLCSLKYEYAGSGRCSRFNNEVSSMVGEDERGGREGLTQYYWYVEHHDSRWTWNTNAMHVGTGALILLAPRNRHGPRTCGFRLERR